MNDNIISINIPNAVSIVIMATIGALAWAALKKGFAGGKVPFATTVSQSQNNPAYWPG